MMMGTAGIALIVVILLIVGFTSAAPPSFFTRAAIAVAVLFLIWRQVSRRRKGKTPRAAKPDPKSTLHLN